MVNRLIRAVGTTLLLFWLLSPDMTSVADSKDKAPLDCQVYVASPYGFSEATRSFMHERLYNAVKAAGCQVLDPWRHEISTTADLLELGRKNARDIDIADGVVAVLDGSDVDSGTAAEVGYASAKGKWIIGYRSDFRRAGEGNRVTVNLQVEYFIRAAHNGMIVKSLSELTQAVKTIIK